MRIVAMLTVMTMQIYVDVIACAMMMMMVITSCNHPLPLCRDLKVYNSRPLQNNQMFVLVNHLILILLLHGCSTLVTMLKIQCHEGGRGRCRPQKSNPRTIDAKLTWNSSVRAFDQPTECVTLDDWTKPHF